MQTFIKPARLVAGDTVCAISLSSGAAAAFPRRYEQGKRQLEETFGLGVIEAPHALEDDDWLYRNPRARAEDLHWALENPEVKAIISIIGGDDSVRMMPYLDLDRIRSNPKVFLGYSDATITLNAFQAAGVVAFHGPAVMTDLAENGGVSPFVERSMRRVLFEAWTGPLDHAAEWTEQHLDWSDETLMSRPRDLIPSEGPVWLQGDGVMEGRLTGGNIEALEFLKGTDWWPPASFWDGAVLAFETSEEAPAPRVVGRFLRNYGAQGILQRAAGLLLARPQNYVTSDRWRLYEEVLRALAEVGRSDMPVVANLDFGHTSPQMVLPLGCRVRIDGTEQQLVLLEAGVS